MPRGAEAISPPHAGQLRRGHRGVCTKAVGLPYGAKPQALQSSMSTRPPSQRPSSYNPPDLLSNCPSGYKIYQKEKEDVQKDVERIMAKNVEKKDAQRDHEKMIGGTVVDNMPTRKMPRVKCPGPP